MRKYLSIKSMLLLLFVSQQIIAQDCKTNADLDTVPGRFLTAAQYPWPAVRAEYFKNMVTANDKAMAKQILTQIESAEQQTHNGFSLTGGNWENYYSTKGYVYIDNTKLGQYTFESSMHDFFCLNGKLKRNDEANTILRITVNAIPLNTLDRFIRNPFGSSFGDYDFGIQYKDWKNHKPADVDAQLISLFTYMSCTSNALLESINNGNKYFQDVAEKDIKPNNRSNYVYRYWFINKSNLPLLVPVTRKEYLQSLLEYYEREKIYFPKLVTQLNEDHDKGVQQYSSWEADVNDKIAVVKKVLTDHNEEWLAETAVINSMEDAAQTYKAGLKERTNYKRFWKFYTAEKQGETLYKYNPAYFTSVVQNPAKPQFISIAFRYVSTPSSLRLLNNFTQKMDMTAIKKLLD